MQFVSSALGLLPGAERRPGLTYNMSQAHAEASVRGIAIMGVQQELGDKSARKLSQQTDVMVEPCPRLLRRSTSATVRSTLLVLQIPTSREDRPGNFP